MKYNDGDTVRVRKDLQVGQAYGYYSFSKNMSQFLGEKAMIVRKEEGRYSLDIDCGTYPWTDEMLESVAESHKIVITSDGKTTECVIYDEKDRIKGTESICSPDDKYDFMTGAKIAFDRLYEAPKSPIQEAI